MGWLAVTAFAVVLLSSAASSQSSGTGCTTPEGQSGVCVPIKHCPNAKRLLQGIKKGSATNGSLSDLHVLPCARNAALVCCPVRRRRARTPVASNVKCGVRGLDDKIVGGEDAPLGAWPWMVILRGRVNGRRSWFCGGALVSDRYVLTAAHCFKESLGVVVEKARIGEHTLSFDPDCSKGRCAPSPQDIPVERIIRHPQYGSPCTECNDIALLRLSRPAVLHSGFVTPVCLPINPDQDMGFSEHDFQGKAAWAAGWGSTARGPFEFRRPDVLQQVQLPIQELNYCDRLRIAYPDPRMALCAGGEGRDTCRGDSGGPLTLDSSDGKRSFVVGITSLGPKVCGSADTQGIYTNVVFYTPWILETIEE
ncbi:LOW QUALITY PROTEIN: phenoloxidase-activating factor 3-like [Penaeus monodon]|uniref:LOW QUALITY PROTEIN: phenoloxidase-activating factor 3-like n=1 Tax=Penaeus monodon TaxID=6687 RepID=UPI0018A73FB7|nr:LOW QUALITY PROTEIN: phenoloxidase-activating factor 3-like [Penaeus monodon]